MEYQVKKTVQGITGDKSGQTENKEVENKSDKVELALDSFSLEKSKKARAGEDVSLKVILNNKGKEFKGIEIELSGNAIKKKLIAPPYDQESFVSVRGKGLNLSPPKVSLYFAPKNPDTMVCSLPELICNQELIEVFIKFKLNKPGKAKIDLTLKPIESKDPKNTINKTATLHIYRGKGKQGSLINSDYVDPLEDMQNTVDRYSK